MEVAYILAGVRLHTVKRSEFAEGVGFEPTRTVTRPSGFQDRRTRPLCEPSWPKEASKYGTSEVPGKPTGVAMGPVWARTTHRDWKTRRAIIQVVPPILSVPA
jgi:hypothetical protein